MGIQGTLAQAPDGYRVVDRNWTCRGGEIDLVCTDGDTLVRFPGSDVIFTGDFFRSAGYPNIDAVLKEIRDHKADLLRVLKRPEVPLHNNASESDIREYVKKRKISGGTRSTAGRRCRDSFASLKKTCRKLGVNFWTYLQDRVRGLGKVARLADLIRQRAAKKQALPTKPVLV